MGFKLQYIAGICCMAVLLFGCSTMNVLQSVEYTCASATALINATTTLVPKSNTAAQTKISHAISILTPICTQDTVPTLDSTAHATLTAAINELQGTLPK